MARECVAAYERYEFHVVMQQLMSFCSDDLGSFYLDVLKDACTPAASAAGAPLGANRAGDDHSPARDADGAGAVVHGGGGGRR